VSGDTTSGPEVSATELAYLLSFGDPTPGMYPFRINGGALVAFIGGQAVRNYAFETDDSPTSASLRIGWVPAVDIVQGVGGNMGGNMMQGPVGSVLTMQWINAGVGTLLRVTQADESGTIEGSYDGVSATFLLGGAPVGDLALMNAPPLVPSTSLALDVAIDGLSLGTTPGEYDVFLAQGRVAATYNGATVYNAARLAPSVLRVGFRPEVHFYDPDADMELDGVWLAPTSTSVSLVFSLPADWSEEMAFTSPNAEEDNAYFGTSRNPSETTSNLLYSSIASGYVTDDTSSNGPQLATGTITYPLAFSDPLPGTYHFKINGGALMAFIGGRAVRNYAFETDDTPSSASLRIGWCQPWTLCRTATWQRRCGRTW